MAGIYIHIPFCATRCIYCGFYSTTLSPLKERYTDAVIREYSMRHDYLNHEAVETVYLGGGTPSQLSKPQLERLLKTVVSDNKDTIKEVTMECNPDDVTRELAEFLPQAGVNRVSMGVQTFDDNRLRFLHRRHNSEEVYTALRLLHEAGISNISIDLMFGFPGEALGEWREDIEQAISLDVNHISAYSLMYEEGTPLYHMLENGQIEESDEELTRSMFYTLSDLLAGAGYEHYEISNFAKPGFRSMHNSSYWHGTPYLGLGAAAHSYDRQSRQWNISDVRKYILSIEEGKIPFEREQLDMPTRYDDLITTALRTREGIDLEKMRREYGEKLYTYLIYNARDKIARGTMKIEDGHLSITRDGLFISDDIMSDLMYV